MNARSGSRPHRWITGAVAGIVLATFFSDSSQETATAVLPSRLASIGQETHGGCTGTLDTPADSEAGSAVPLFRD
jgi:hypothetical protein